MAFQPVPDTAQVSMMFEGVGGSALQGSKAQVGLYVRDTATPTPWTSVTLTQLAQYTLDWFDTGKNGGGALKTAFNPDWSLVEVVARDLENSAGVVVHLVGGQVGTQAGDPVPPSLPMWVKFNGTPGSFPKDGGIYLPVGSESSLDGNLFASGFTDAVEQMVTDWRVDLNDPSSGGNVLWAHVIVSRSLTTNDDVKDARAALRAAIAATRRATAVTNTVASIVARELVSSQRDRRAL